MDRAATDHFFLSHFAYTALVTSFRTKHHPPNLPLFDRMESPETCENIIKTLSGHLLDNHSQKLVIKFADGNKKRQQQKGYDQRWREHVDASRVNPYDAAPLPPAALNGGGGGVPAGSGGAALLCRPRAVPARTHLAAPVCSHRRTGAVNGHGYVHYTAGHAAAACGGRRAGGGVWSAAAPVRRLPPAGGLLPSRQRRPACLRCTTTRI